MTDTRYTQVLSEVVAEYRSLNPKSEQISSASAAVLPGGTTRTTTFFSPFPPALTEGSGSRVVDADGNSRVDYLNNYTSMILGHAHPDVVARVALVASQGTGFASPTEHEVRLAEMLVERVDSVDMVRFTNSGTEATMAALRLARAFTGREEVARVVGSYHGTHDYATTPAAGVPQAVAHDREVSRSVRVGIALFEPGFQRAARGLRVAQLGERFTETRERLGSIRLDGPGGREETNGGCESALGQGGASAEESQLHP